MEKYRLAKTIEELPTSGTMVHKSEIEANLNIDKAEVANHEVSKGLLAPTTTKTSHAVDTAQRVSQCHASSFYHVSDQKVFSMFVLLLIGLV